VDVTDPVLAPIVAGSRVMVEVVADTPAGATATGAVWVTATPLTVTDTVFVPLAVELNVPVATPLPSVVPDGVSVLPAPVAENTTFALGIRLPNVSRAVTVMVD
jgi:hypothetical protein